MFLDFFCSLFFLRFSVSDFYYSGVGVRCSPAAHLWPFRRSGGRNGRRDKKKQQQHKKKEINQRKNPNQRKSTTAATHSWAVRRAVNRVNPGVVKKRRQHKQNPTRKTKTKRPSHGSFFLEKKIPVFSRNSIDATHQEAFLEASRDRCT